MRKLTPFQQKLLECYKLFSKFCYSHSIRFCGAYGTCLGAIRHQGFIPWDDDMDVYMFRSDYDRFISLRQHILEETNGRCAVSDLDDKHYPYPFAKFYLTDSTIWEVRQFPFLIGPWIDIFPIDEWDDSSKNVIRLYNDYHLHTWNYRKAISYQTWNEIYYDLKSFNGFEGLVKIVKQCLYKPLKKVYLKKVREDLSDIKRVRGDFYKYWGAVRMQKYEKSWFSNWLVVPFEDSEITVPGDYDSYLKYTYGDYMTLPPESKRFSHHSYYFIDLDKKLSKVQIEKNYSDKLNERPPLPLSILLDEFRHKKGF